jgi:chemoreceptor zinc-binding protein
MRLLLTGPWFVFDERGEEDKTMAQNLLRDEIKKAIGAHGAWKQRLRTAVDTGKSEFKPDLVGRDDQCDFGRWLYGPSAAAAKGKDYDTCRQLHADFHRQAADVLRLALAGQKEKAMQAIGEDSKYAGVSGKLTMAMMSWIKTLGG